MKRFLPILSLAFFITACTSNPAENETQTLQSAQQQNALSVDTAGLAQFQAWKAQNELAAAAPVEQQAQQAEPVKTVTVIREVRVQQPAPVRRTVRQQQPAPVQQQPTPAQQPQSETPSSAGNNDVASNTGSGSEGEASPQETAKNGGWSKATKGAVIGGAGGAVIGAVINKKNRAAGAVIGGVLGGAVGYGLGKKKDNKDAQQ